VNRRDPLGSRHAALRLSRRLRQAQRQLQAQPANAPGLTLADVLALHGPSSMATLLMLYALFCVMPVGGVGNVFGVALWLLSWQWARGRPHALPARVAGMRLNPRWSLRLLRLLAAGYRQAGRWLRPRWAPLMAGWTRGWWAGWIALQALVIFLPIPLGNLLPAFSLVALGLGRLLSDGLMLGLSLAIGVLGLVYTAALGHVAWLLTFRAWEGLLHRLG
jgi:hypothetical protein